ncbi:M23 family metallopeptidase [Nesterenkonia xinjiangensis]|uniref:M23ase beta-sheet core domain-containing protein n=1 Tax=Nesterenkonia xinjiangensis TaxID=225327 RepID=A0A7Z0K8M9_9MICC|nr:M23 family metallopeptidase [Nesterenkonia xinjiangensis]NYJ76833.1 hypothetical protein [Nesterenkonia xinjiangensis]
MTTTIDLDYPSSGKWLVENSPADRVPSHGTSVFASAYAIDFAPVSTSGRTAPMRLGSFIRPEPPHRFPGFRRPILSPIDGVVVATRDDAPDHVAHRGLPSLSYALSQRQRVAGGWESLAGNYVFIESDGAVIALCHLQQASVAVGPGQRVSPGEIIAGCGNSGNSTEPHLHVQAVDSTDIGSARPIPVTFRGSVPHNRETVDVSR